MTAAKDDPPIATAGMGEAVERLREELRRNGPRAAAQRLLHGVSERVRLDETHVWYELATGEGRPRVDLPEGFVFRAGGPDDLPLLARLPTIFAAEGAAQLDAGHDLWLVLDGDRPAFACWTFRRTMPLPGAPADELVLPPGTAFVEDSVTAPDYRGRRLGPAAWTLLADTLAARGVDWLITKIREDNVATHKSVLKSGFRQMALVHHHRVLGRSRLRVTEPAGPNGEYVRGALG